MVCFLSSFHNPLSTLETTVIIVLFLTTYNHCVISSELNKNTKCRLHLWGKTSAERKNLYLLVGQGIA